QADARAAAPEAADAERHPPAVSVDHGHLLGRHRQLLGDDLRQGRLDSLADRGDAGVDDHAARAVHLDARVLPGPEPRLLEDAAEADPEIAALLSRLGLFRAHRLVVRQRQRLVERRAIVTAVVDRPLAQRGAADLVRHLARVDEVAATDVGRIEPERGRHAVDQALADERALVPPGAGVGARG